MSINREKQNTEIISLRDAIGQSCDIYFYKVGSTVGPDAINERSSPTTSEKMSETTRAG